MRYHILTGTENISQTELRDEYMDLEMAENVALALMEKETHQLVFIVDTAAKIRGRGTTGIYLLRTPDNRIIAEEGNAGVQVDTDRPGWALKLMTDTMDMEFGVEKNPYRKGPPYAFE